jgi:transcriptional regulator with XRE-family HTH domain
MLRVKEICKGKGVKLKDLAKQLKVSQGTLSQNIGGRVSLKRLQEIASALGVQVSDLLDEEPAEFYMKRRGEMVRLIPEKKEATD